VVTSPPYWGLRDYGMAGQIGLEKTPAEYVEHIVAVFAEVWRVLRDDGTCWVNLGDSYFSHDPGGYREGEFLNPDGRPPVKGQARNRAGNYVEGAKRKDLVGIPWRVAFALQAAGWYLRSDIIWSKPNPMPESVTDRPTKAHEYIFLLSKSERYFFDQDAVREPTSENTHKRAAVGQLASMAFKMQEPGLRNRNNTSFQSYMQDLPEGTPRNIRTVWEIATQPYAEAHFATFPQELAERCIKAGTSEKGCCSACGKAWARVVEVSRIKDPTRHTGRAAVGCDDRQDGDWPRMLTENKTLGWQPTCKCGGKSEVILLPQHGNNITSSLPIRPCVVLDPFSGAGTVPLVADKLGRRGIGLELKPDYCKMARLRCFDDAPLFAL
jgi:DNA modification methylase